MSKSTSQAEHLKDMLVGNIIAVSWPEVYKTAILYGIVGVFHFVFRRQFLAISLQHDEPERTGLNVRFWDFLFYASFGFVVTSSVAIAGVLLVFCYLIVPSVAAMLYAETVGRRLAIGWTMGTVVSAAGVYLSLGARPADRGNHCVHVRRGSRVDVGGTGRWFVLARSVRCTRR